VPHLFLRVSFYKQTKKLFQPHHLPFAVTKLLTSTTERSQNPREQENQQRQVEVFQLNLLRVSNFRHPNSHWYDVMGNVGLKKSDVNLVYYRVECWSAEHFYNFLIISIQSAKGTKIAPSSIY